MICQRVAEGQHRTMLGMSLMLQEFGNGIYMAPQEPMDESVSVLAGETAMMHAWG